MKSFIFLFVCLNSAAAFAWEGEFQRRRDAEVEEMSRHSQEVENAHFMAESQVIADRLAAINNTSVSFNPNVRNSPAPMGEDLVAGEWNLGNSGVCVRSVWTDAVYCNGAIGFSNRKIASHKKRRRK
jgi:hypothetical protein